MLHNFLNAVVALGPVGILLLAILDSAGVPIAGAFDALLIFLTVETPSRAVWLAAMAIVGSTAGNVGLFLAARRGGRRFLEKSASPGRAKRFREWFLRYGLVTVFVPALLPIPLPLKVFVICAGVLRTSVPAFVSVILVARVLRYSGEAWLGATVGRESAAFLKTHVWDFALAGVVLFILLYWLIRFSDRWRRQIEP